MQNIDCRRQVKTVKDKKVSHINRINPKKLLLSKWTSIKPERKERHFIVTELIKDENEGIVGCILEAVINKKQYKIVWQDLNNNEKWLMGWK